VKSIIQKKKGFNDSNAPERGKQKMKVIDLFCGAGGLSEGFKKAGFEVVKALDNDSFAVKHFNKNVARVAELTDLSKPDMPDLPDADGIIGGPPCQGFSIAGKRKLTDPRSSLSLVFTEIVRKKQPTWFVMENVDGLLSMDFRHLLMKHFADGGYPNTKVLLLEAVKYGVAQFRKRLFFVGFLNNSCGLGLLPSPLPPEDWKKVKDVLPNYEYKWYYRHPRTYGRRAVYSVDEPSPTIRTVNRPMPPNYRRHPGDAPYIEGQVRALTAEERALLQSFPRHFAWEGAETVKNTLIGNAVPPLLARIIASAIKNSLS